MNETYINLAPAIQDKYYITHPGPWAGHIPFAYWIVSVIKPKIIVELGTYKGNSYFNFCHAVQKNYLKTKTYAIDTWNGDVQSGFYGENIFSLVNQYNNENFSGFSTLIRSTFDDALGKFEDGSIDLLHIDGLHTYESVKNDFTKWLPKMSSSGVVLLHDIAVYTGNFGVWKFFEDLKRKYPTFWFNHSNGLGVVMVGSDVNPDLYSLVSSLENNGSWKEATAAFSNLGKFCELESQKIGEGYNKNLENTMEYKNSTVELLRGALTVQKNFSLARKELEGFKNHINHLQREIGRQDSELHQKNDHINNLNQHIENINGILSQKDADINIYKTSTSWKFSAPLRGAGIFIRKLKTFSSLISGGKVKLIKKILNEKINPISSRKEPKQEMENLFSIMVIATPHTLYVANLIASSLTSLGFDVGVQTEMPKDFTSRLYFVVCAQMFQNLPPADRRICVQLEQTTMSRWFTEKYIDVLNASLAVIEYTNSGIKFLDGMGISYPKVYYAQIGALPDYINYVKNHGIQLSSEEKEYDVLFYGDANNIRRNKILEAVGKNFNVKVVSNLFGADLYREILKARVCLNIHYYEDSALESTRVFEALSLGIPVVSEVSNDQGDYDFSQYGESISFVDLGDCDAIVSSIQEMISKEVTVDPSANRNSGGEFHFYISRIMLALGFIDFRRFYSQSNRTKIDSNKIVLSMPETFERHAFAKKKQNGEIFCFSGLRATPGWVGAAYSFKYLAKKLLESDCEFVLIHEDDAVFSDVTADEIFEFAIRIYREKCQWDVFSAFISDLHPDAKVSSIFEFDKMECALIDKMVGMVCNVYSRKSLEIIAQWDEKNLDIESNTIDRYLENIEDLKIVTTFPFLVGHNDMANSSMWGVKNYSMRGMINKSQDLLFEKMWFKKIQNVVDNDDGIINK